MSSTGGGGGGGTPDPTPEERALAERGAREFNDFRERGVPLANKFISTVTDPAYGERIAGQTSAAVADAFAGDMRAAVERGAATGASAGSAGAIMSAATGSLKHVSAAGLSAGKARLAAKDRALTGRIKMSAFGRGVGEDSSLGLRSRGLDATRESIAEAEARTDRFVSGLEGLGTVAGYAGGAAIREYSMGRQLGLMQKADPNAKVTRPSGLAGWAYDRQLR